MNAWEALCGWAVAMGTLADEGIWVRVAGGVALSSLVAGVATAPIAAAHFNRVPHYGLVANLLAVPVMGSVVMPGAVVAAIRHTLRLYDEDRLP